MFDVARHAWLGARVVLFFRVGPLVPLAGFPRDVVVGGCFVADAARANSAFSFREVVVVRCLFVFFHRSDAGRVGTARLVREWEHRFCVAVFV